MASTPAEGIRDTGLKAFPRTDLGEAHVTEGFEGKVTFLAATFVLLPLVDPGGRERRDAHAVSQEQDDVLGDVGVFLDAQSPEELRLGQVVPVILVWKRERCVSSKDMGESGAEGNGREGKLHARGIQM